MHFRKKCQLRVLVAVYQFLGGLRHKVLKTIIDVRLNK